MKVRNRSLEKLTDVPGYPESGSRLVIPGHAAKVIVGVEVFVTTGVSVGVEVSSGTVVGVKVSPGVPVGVEVSSGIVVGVKVSPGVLVGVGVDVASPEGVLVGTGVPDDWPSQPATLAIIHQNAFPFW